MRTRVTILHLTAVVLVSGLALAALLYASVPWAIVLLALLLISALVGAHRISTTRGSSRAFAYGLTLGGLGYFIGAAGHWIGLMMRTRVMWEHTEAAWIGHLLLSLLAGTLAGFVARHFAERGERGDADGIRG